MLVSRLAQHAEPLQLAAQLLAGGAVLQRQPQAQRAVREAQLEGVDRLHELQPALLEVRERLGRGLQRLVVVVGHLVEQAPCRRPPPSPAPAASAPCPPSPASTSAIYSQDLRRTQVVRGRDQLHVIIVNQSSLQSARACFDVRSLLTSKAIQVPASERSPAMSTGGSPGGPALLHSFGLVMHCRPVRHSTRQTLGEVAGVDSKKHSPMSSSP